MTAHPSPRPPSEPAPRRGEGVRPSHRPEAKPVSYFPEAPPAYDVPRLAYRAVRPELEDGDILFFRGRHFLSRVVRTLSRGEYSHCGMVATWAERKVILHADILTGVTISTVSTMLETYDGELHWFRVRPHLRDNVDPQRLLEEARSQLHRSYAWSGVVLATATAWLRVPARRELATPEGYFCSQYVSRCYRLAGLPLTDVGDNVTSPSLLAASPCLERQAALLPPSRSEAPPAGVAPDQAFDWGAFDRDADTM